MCPRTSAALTPIIRLRFGLRNERSVTSKLRVSAYTSASIFSGEIVPTILVTRRSLKSHLISVSSVTPRSRIKPSKFMLLLSTRSALKSTPGANGSMRAFFSTTSPSAKAI